MAARPSFTEADVPNRMLRDSITTSETLDHLSPHAEVMFYRLITVADDHGRFHADPRVLLAKCFPLRVASLAVSDVLSWRNELVCAGLVELYQDAAGGVFGRFLTWTTHQRVRAARSKYPDPASCVPTTPKVQDSARSDCSSQVIENISTRSNDSRCQQMTAHAGADAQSESKSESKTKSETKAPQTPRRRGARSPEVLLPDEARVLEALTAATGRTYRTTSPEMRARLARDGLEACLLVVEHLAADPDWRPGGKLERYLDTVTPFRPGKWDSRRALAEQWDREGRRPIGSGGGQHAANLRMLAEFAHSGKGGDGDGE